MASAGNQRTRRHAKGFFKAQFKPVELKAKHAATMQQRQAAAQLNELVRMTHEGALRVAERRYNDNPTTTNYRRWKDAASRVR